ncbi:hypothetical protein NHG32_08975, partial [Aerococcaceae bacterium NML191219]|nr:hypothetical protein [Aerococcaceae bacterium NML191219]
MERSHKKFFFFLVSGFILWDISNSVIIKAEESELSQNVNSIQYDADVGVYEEDLFTYSEQSENSDKANNQMEDSPNFDQMSEEMSLSGDNSIKYDTLKEKDGKQYYYEPELYGGVLARNKWSYSPIAQTWYYSDSNGQVTQKASRTSYEHNGTQQGDVLVSINNAQVYYEPQSWGGHQAQNKWSYSPSVSTWYYSDVSGWITRKASRTSYEHNGTQQGDVLVSINNAQVYYEPQSWGGHQAQNKWSYSPSVSTWYYSDVSGWIT